MTKPIYLVMQVFPHEAIASHSEVCSAYTTRELAQARVDYLNNVDKEESNNGEYWKFEVWTRPLSDTL